MSKENNALLPSKEFKALCGYHFINLHINLRCVVEKKIFTLQETDSKINPKSIHFSPSAWVHMAQAAITLPKLPDSHHIFICSFLLLYRQSLAIRMLFFFFTEIRRYHT